MVATPAKLVTYEEWLLMPEVSDCIEEVVDGEICIMPPNRESHANIIDNLSDLLREKLDRRTVKVRATVFGLKFYNSKAGTFEPPPSFMRAPWRLSFFRRLKSTSQPSGSNKPT